MNRACRFGQVSRQAEIYFTRPSSSLNSGVPALPNHSNTTISLFTTSTPVLSRRASARRRLDLARESTASATTKASKPWSSRSIAVWVTQTWASMPPITTCPRPLRLSSCRRSRKRSCFAQRRDRWPNATRVLLRDRHRNVEGSRGTHKTDATLDDALRVRHRRQELLLNVDDEQL